jgi:hypothetical protein
VPSPEEWYIPGSSKRDTERGGGLSVSGGRAEPLPSSSAWNPPPREREPLPSPSLAGGGRMAPLKSRSAEWSEAGGRSREWSDVAPPPSLPPPRGGPRDWDRGSREWSDRGGGRDGGRGGIPPPHAYPPFSPPPFKPRYSASCVCVCGGVCVSCADRRLGGGVQPQGPAAGAQAGAEGLPTAGVGTPRRALVRGAALLRRRLPSARIRRQSPPRRRVRLHVSCVVGMCDVFVRIGGELTLLGAATDMSVLGGRLPGHRMAPKAYHEWEYEARFETGPPPLYEPDYRPDYDGAHTHTHAHAHARHTPPHPLRCMVGYHRPAARGRQAIRAWEARAGPGQGPRSRRGAALSPGRPAPAPRRLPLLTDH